MNMIKERYWERPTIDKVLNHPLFWNSDKLMNFFRIITNFMKKYDNQKLDGSINIISSRAQIDVIIEDLKKIRDKVYKKDNWFEEMCPTV